MCMTQFSINLTALSFLPFIFYREGELAQLARASALQAEGQGFKSPILQNVEVDKVYFGGRVL